MADPNEPAKPEPTSDPGAAGGSKGPPDGEGAAPPRDRNQRIRQEAAEKRRAKREAEARRVAPARNLDASEIVDDALVRTTHTLGVWAKKHFNTVQWVLLLAVVGGIGYQIYSYRRGRAIDRAGDAIARALSAERARVGASESPGPDRYTGLTDSRQEFPSESARLKAAEAEYRKAESATSGVSQTLATLGLAGILYDQGKYKDAQAAYQKVKESELSKLDRDARGRAIEGIGLSLEAQGQSEAALQAFRELSNTDIPGLKDLGQYHQARLLIARGERDKARDILRKLVEKLTKADEKEGAGQSLLERQSQELLAVVDPNAVSRPGTGITAEQLERLKQQLKLKGQAGVDAKGLEEALRQLNLSGGTPGPGNPPAAPQAPAPAPAGSAP